MATAPDPNSYAEEVGARQFLRLTVKGRTLDVVLGISMQEKFAVRLQTGMPLEAFMPAQSVREFGEDSMFVLWWLARRQNGEPNLALAEAEADWPTDAKPGDLDAIEIDLDDEGEEADSPES